MKKIGNLVQNFETTPLHDSAHEGKKSFNCEICDTSFSAAKDLKSHIDSVHEGNKPFNCDFCDASFIVGGDLKSHIDSVHEEKKPFKCDICDTTFSDSRVLKVTLTLSMKMKRLKRLHIVHLKSSLLDMLQLGM